MATMRAERWIDLCRKPRAAGCILCLALACAAFVPVVSAQSAAPDAAANAKVPSYAVSWVKPTRITDGSWRCEATADGWSALDVSALQVITEAYALDQEDRVLGAPAWLSAEKFDFEAKVDDADAAAYQALPYDQKRVALQRFLTERFGLVFHYENRERATYVVMIAKGGPKMRESASDPDNWIIKSGSSGLVRRGNLHHLEAEKFTMPGLARYLTNLLRVPVLDETGLTGRYDFELDWTLNLEANISAADGASSSPPAALPSRPLTSGLSIFAAVRQQLGLELEPQKRPIPVLVIDHVSEPTPN